MKFGPVACGEAAGAVLAHSLKVGGRTLKKGRVLQAGDISALREAGFERVVVARLEATDVDEDTAAAALASLLAGPGLRVSAPFTGRCNLFAEQPGLLLLDEGRIDALNRIDEALTAATLHGHAVVAAKQMVATIKVIPFAVPGDALDAARECLARGAPPIGVAGFTRTRVALIQTQLEGTRASVLDKTRTVLARRVEALGSELGEEVRCAHEPESVSAALAGRLEAGAGMVLIAGASAIVDRRDVVPEGIERAGGRVEHFGMPVDPGNLLLLARHGRVPVLGLPGCARSPKFNGFDEVLQRLLAGLEVVPGDIMAMGVGGLLKEFSQRPQPRNVAAGEAGMAPARAPRVGAVVLAGGQSRRMGTVNKLLAEVDGVPMLARVVDAALGAAVDGVYVVTGHQREAVVAALEGRAVEFVHNPDYAGGLSTSMHAALGALPSDLDGVIVCLGDMPRVTSAHLDRLLAAFDPVEGRSICVPTFEGARGNPVLWAARFIPEMQEVKGDVGARHLIGEYADQVCEVAMDDAAVLTDVDSPAALRRLRAQAG